MRMTGSSLCFYKHNSHGAIKNQVRWAKTSKSGRHIQGSDQSFSEGILKSMAGSGQGIFRMFFVTFLCSSSYEERICLLCLCVFSTSVHACILTSAYYAFCLDIRKGSSMTQKWKDLWVGDLIWLCYECASWIPSPSRGPLWDEPEGIWNQGSKSNIKGLKQRSNLRRSGCLESFQISHW